MLVMDEERRTKFQRAYSNLPLEFRTEICLVIDDEPLTWNVAKLEIDNNSEKGKKILDKLFELAILI